MGTLKDIMDSYFTIKDKSRKLIKKHDYEKYVELIEEEYDKLYKQVINLQSQIDELTKKDRFVLNDMHGIILNAFHKEPGSSLHEVQISKLIDSFDIEIAYSELLDNKYIVFTRLDEVHPFGWIAFYMISSNKRTEVLKFLNNFESQ